MSGRTKMCVADWYCCQCGKRNHWKRRSCRKCGSRQREWFTYFHVLYSNDSPAELSKMLER